MIHQHPADSKKVESEELFWEDKRFPEPIKPSYEDKDSFTYLFVLSMSKLFAEIFEIELPTQDIVEKLVVQRLTLEADSDYGHELEKTTFEQSGKEIIQNFKQQVKNSLINEVKLLKPIDIYDQKYHDQIVTFIFSASNLRCQNFKLETTSQHRVEELVYKIKPNLNVTGTMAGAMANMDLIKMVSGISKEMYRTTSIYCNRGTMVFEKN